MTIVSQEKAKVNSVANSYCVVVRTAGPLNERWEPMGLVSIDIESLVELFSIDTEPNGAKLSLLSMGNQQQKGSGNGIICHAKFHPVIPWFSSPVTTQEASHRTADTGR